MYTHISLSIYIPLSPSSYMCIYVCVYIYIYIYIYICRSPDPWPRRRSRPAAAPRHRALHSGPPEYILIYIYIYREREREREREKQYIITYTLINITTIMCTTYITRTNNDYELI